jgi:hypothetical protein
MIIIGVTGKAGCGKNTVADYLRDTYSFKTLAFADPIKDMLCSLLSISREELELEKVKSIPHPILGVTARSALQTLGTEWGRDRVNSNLWARIVEDRIKVSGSPMHVISDLRFLNEAEMVVRNKGTIFYVIREDTNDRIQGETEKSHASEGNYDKILKAYKDRAITIANNGSIEDLHQKLDFTIKNLVPTYGT